MQSSNPDAGVIATLGWIDLTALAIVLVFFVLGLFRGFVWQISRIVTLVAAYVVAGLYGDDVAARIQGWFSEGVHPKLPLYIAYFVLFLVVLIIVSVIAYFIDKLVQKTGLSFYNRVGGGVLGIGTGACVVVALLAGILMFTPAASNVAQAAESSQSMTVSKRAIELLGDVVPQSVREMFGVAPAEGGGEQKKNEGK